MKINLYTVVPLALAVGSMAATTNAPKETKKSGQSDLKVLLADFLSVEGNLLAQTDQKGYVKVSYFETTLTKEEEPLASALWRQKCSDETDLVYAALKKPNPLHTQTMKFGVLDGELWLITYCGAVLPHGETEPEQILWLSGSVSKKLGWLGLFGSRFIPRPKPDPKPQTGAANKVNK